MIMDKRLQLSAKNKTDLMPNNASCKRWDTPHLLLLSVCVTCLYLLYLLLKIL